MGWEMRYTNDILARIYRMMADYDVQMCDGDRVGEFYVKFHGPKGSTFISTRASIYIY